jgi:hypothetical protein
VQHKSRHFESHLPNQCQNTSATTWDHYLSCERAHQVMQSPQSSPHTDFKPPLSVKIGEVLTTSLQRTKRILQILSPVLLILSIILVVYISLCSNGTSVKRKRPYRHDSGALRALAGITSLISLSLFGSAFGSWRSNKRDLMKLEGALWDCAVLQLMSALRAVTLLWATTIVADRWFKQ